MTLEEARSAGFWLRAAGALVDAGILGAGWAVLAWTLHRADALATEPDAALVPVIAHSIAALPWVVPGGALLLLALFWRGLGATPGQALLGCRVVVAHTGRRPGLARALARSVALVLALAPLGAGVIWCAFDARNRGLHDRLAGTLVVVEDESLLTLEELVGGLR